MKSALPILLLAVLNAVSFSQERELSGIITSIVEELADDETDPESVAVYVEKLYDLSEKPVKLNTADETELARLFFLTDFQTKALIDYIITSGKIVSLFEISNIPGFNREQVELIIPFITLEPAKEVTIDSAKMRNSFISNFSTKFTPTQAVQTGSPWKLLTRYKFTLGKLSGGFTTEKDSGEKLFSGKLPLPDFLSTNLAWNGKGILRKIIVGDFSGRFGIGTNINTGLRSGLSLTASGYLSGGDEIRPYTSTDENNFFRGIAVTLQLKKTGISLFYSFNRIDASIDQAGTLLKDHITSFYRSGLHNTPSLEARKNVIGETSYGINVSQNFSSIRIGFLYSGCRFPLPVYSDTLNPEKLFDFRGNDNNIASVYYKASYRKMIFFGEFSVSSDKKKALVQGLSFRPSDRLNINLLYRIYDPGFTSFHGKGIFSSSSGDNIKGLFGNFTFEAAKHFFISAGCDLKYYTWLNYRCSAPSISKSSEIRIKFLPGAKITIDASWNYRFSMQDNTDDSAITRQSESVGSTLKGSVKYSLNENLTFVLRSDHKVTTGQGVSTGMLILQDIYYRFGNIPLRLWFRYCIYRTGDWNSRLYTYENDLASAFNVPALYGSGNRSYMMAEWSFGKRADLRVKYSISELIKENYEPVLNSELKLQLKLWF